MAEIQSDPWAGRHPSVRHFGRVFTPNPKLQTTAAHLARVFEKLALDLIETCNDGPELSTALRKLREAKDCAVLQSVFDAQDRTVSEDDS